MSNNNLIPKIRFEEFNNSKLWIKRELIDYADVRDGTHDSPKYQEKGHPFITSKNVANGYINYEDVQYISTEDFNNINKRSKVDKNDILMGMIGTIGNIALVREEPDYAIKNVALIKESNRIYYLYLYHLFQSNIIKKQLKDAMDGGTQKFIALNRIRTLNIKAPQKKEQYKIGSFFEKLDKMIQLQQSKVNKVKDIKSAYLSEMFPKEGEKYPKKRFEGFTDPWKETRLSDFVSKAVDNRGKTPPLSDEGTHPLIEVASIGDYYPNYSKVEKYLDDIAFDNNLRGYIKQNDILFSTVGRIGLVSLMDHNKDAAIAQNIVAFRATENNIPEYIYALLSAQTNKEKSERIVMGAVQPSIKVSQLENVKYLITDNIKEQQLIGSFFAKLENIIIYNQNHLMKLKELKIAYLNDMFV